MKIRITTFLIIATALLAIAPTASAEMLVRVIAPTKAYTEPAGTKVVHAIPTQTPYGHEQLQLRVLKKVDGELDPVTNLPIRYWYKVHLPYRPNGLSGWVSSDNVQEISSPWHVIINRKRRTLTLKRNGRRYNRWRVVVGRPSMPTPRGQFAIYGKTRRASVDGPGIMPFAYSNVLKQFDGGDGMVALHGVSAALNDPMGSAASHGCVRNPNNHVRWMLKHLPIGTPVDVI